MINTVEHNCCFQSSGTIMDDWCCRALVAAVLIPALLGLTVVGIPSTGWALDPSSENGTQDASARERLRRFWDQSDDAMWFGQWRIAHDNLTKGEMAALKAFSGQHWCVRRIRSELEAVERVLDLPEAAYEEINDIQRRIRQQWSLVKVREFDKSAAVASEVTSRLKKLGFADSILYVDHQIGRSSILSVNDQHAEAVAVIEEILPACEVMLASDDFGLLTAYSRLGAALTRSSRVFEAEVYLRTAVERAEAYSASEREVHSGCRKLEQGACQRLATYLAAIRRFRAAEHMANRVVTLSSWNSGVDGQKERAMEMLFIAEVKTLQGNEVIDVEQLKLCSDVIKKAEGDDSIFFFDALRMHINVLVRLQRIEEAFALYRMLDSLAERSGHADIMQKAEYREMHAFLLSRSGQLKLAESAFVDAFAEYRKYLGDEHPWLIDMLREAHRVTSQLNRVHEAGRWGERLRRCEQHLAGHSDNSP